MSSEQRPFLLPDAPPTGAASPRDVEVEVTPIVVAVMGLPGAGKSVVARAIEDQLHLRRVCRDQIRAAMFPRCSFSFIEKRAANRSLMLALEINCMLRVGSVIDGMTFSHREELDRIAELSLRHHIVTIPLFVDCPLDVARARVARDLSSNVHLAHDRTPELVSDVYARRDPPPAGTLYVDGTLPTAQMCREAVAVIRNSINGVAPESGERRQT